MATSLKLYNTLTRDKVDFAPIDADNVRMYVCGPTVYDFAHIGNARPVIVFDVLYRLLRHVYGESHVTYVRNITDVDDKINARALRDFGAQIADGSMTLNDAIRAVTGKTESQFHADVAALGCLKPTVEPRATDNIGQMIAIIQRLLDQGHAYVASGSEGHEVLFATASMADYGQLSKRKLEDQQAGARIAVEAHKTNPGDFVLWKQSADTEPGWSASFTFEGRTVAIHGRPGWHIECSAMSDRYLWEEIKDRLSPKAKARPHQFDIHGGGLDLIFPHHENEIAQSCCAFDTDVMANVWMHNGFLQVEGRKMSKSEGNFVTIRDNLRGIFPGWTGGPVYGGVFRLAMLSTNYRQPIDWTKQRLIEAGAKLEFWYRVLGHWQEENWQEYQENGFGTLRRATPLTEVVNALADDLDTHRALQAIGAGFEAGSDVPALAASMELLGLLNEDGLKAFSSFVAEVSSAIPHDNLYFLASQFGVASANNDVQFAREIENKLSSQGLTISSLGPGVLDLKIIDPSQKLDVDALIKHRLELLKTKNFFEADKLRNELLAKGIQLKDGKDPETGERVTTWEVKR